MTILPVIHKYQVMVTFSGGFLTGSTSLPMIHSHYNGTKFRNIFSLRSSKRSLVGFDITKEVASRPMLGPILLDV